MCWLILLRGARILDNDVILLGGWIIAGAAMLVVAVLLKTTPADAVRLSSRASVWMILAGTVLLQVAGVVLLSPALSEDVIRYRLEGQMWLNGTSPYGTTPYVFRRDTFARSSGRSEPFQWDFIDQLVRHQDLHSI